MPFKIDKRIVELVESELPGFISESYPNFVFFMQAYFEWLETRTNTISSVIIKQRGTGYAVGDIVTILQKESQSPAYLKIEDVYDGQVLDIILTNPGKNYVVEKNLQTSSLTSASGLTVDILAIDKGSRGAFYGAQQLPEIADIDKTEEEFFDYFEREFMQHIPKTALCDRPTLLKNIKQFYKTRGNEASYRLLFRILFLNEISFYYPTADIIKPDSGDWSQNTSIMIRVPYNANQFDPVVMFNGKSIQGLSSGATAEVDHVVKTTLPGATHYQVIFEKNSLYKSFISFEEISLISSTEFVAQVLPVLTGINVSYQGKGYTVGELVTISNPYKIPMSATISEVGLDGEVEYVQIANPGTGYYPITMPELPTVTFRNAGTETALGEAILDAVFISPGYYLTTDGQPDNIEKLRDDYYYQEFSYQVNTQTNMSEWADVIKKLVHPAGSLAFNNLQIYPPPVNAGIRRTQKPDVKIVYSYLNSRKVKFHLAAPEIDKALFAKIIHDTNEKRVRIGPTLRSINRDAYRYMPTQLFPTTDVYWSGYANYSLADLADLSLSDLKYREHLKV